MTNPELQFLFYKAPRPLDWSTPKSLLLSSLRNRFYRVNGKLYPHPISHVNVVLKTSDNRKLARGMMLANSPLGYLYRFLVKGSSLDTMVINLPGRFIDEKWVWSQLDPFKKSGFIESLSLRLNNEQALRVETYLKLYEDYGLDKIYGALASDPLKGEGAGCSAFAVSTLEILGLLTADLKTAWSRQLRIPQELMSTPQKRAQVGFLGSLFGKNPAWAKDSESCYLLNFWDPEKMFNWSRQQRDHVSFAEIILDQASGELIWDVSAKPLPDLNLQEHFKKIAPRIAEEQKSCGQLWSSEKLKRLI